MRREVRRWKREITGGVIVKVDAVTPQQEQALV